MTVGCVTVAICTWNRCQLLEQTLEEMTAMAVPDGVAWELLVVNNNCTDATDAVIARFANRLPIRRLFEAAPGLSNARNLAVTEAAGAYIVWTDDDVLVAADWLVEYCRAFDRWPDAAVFGGPIAPWFPGAPPEWLATTWTRVAKAYAVLDYGTELLPLTPERMPFGANMAFRTDRQRAFPYDPARGVRPGSRMGGEETQVILAILDEGSPGWWVPTARVRHYIPVDRQTPSYLERYYASYGEHVGRYDPAPHSATLFGHPRWLLKKAALTGLRYLVSRRIRPATAWMDDLISASTARGMLRGYAHRAREGA